MFEVNLCLAWRLLYAMSQQRFVCNFLCFFSLSSPQWSATSAQIPSGEFFHHSSSLVRATAAAGWPYPRLLSVLPESGWSRKPTESTYPPWSQILWIMGFLGKHFVLELFKKIAFVEEQRAIAFPVSNSARDQSIYESNEVYEFYVQSRKTFT